MLIREYKNGKFVAKLHGVVITLTPEGDQWPSLKATVCDKKHRYYYFLYYVLKVDGYEPHPMIKLPSDEFCIFIDDSNTTMNYKITFLQKLEVAQREFKRYFKIRGTRTSWQPWKGKKGYEIV